MSIFLIKKVHPQFLYNIKKDLYIQGFLTFYIIMFRMIYQETQCTG